MSTQLNIIDLIAEGVRLRDAGIKQSSDHAEDVAPGWKDKIFAEFVDWVNAKPSGYFFLLEDFRYWIERNGKIPAPPSKRAYGFLTPKAARAGLIYQSGTAKVKNISAHRANAARWIVK